MLVMTSASFLLATAQPILKPVMAYCFETPLITTSFEFSDVSLA